MVLASTNEDTSIAQLAQLADKVMEVSILTVSNVSVQPSPTALEQLQGEIASLKQVVKILQQATSAQMPCHRSPSLHYHSPNRSHSTTMCWYHLKFGNDAKKCRPPCSHLRNNPASD